jgi:polysaccharide biosynthesis protein PslH
MKILFLTPYTPLPPNFGGAIRIYHILKYLTKHHDVTVAGLGDQQEKKLMEEHFPSLKGKVHYVGSGVWKTSKWITFTRALRKGNSHWHSLTVVPQMQALIDRLLEQHSFDVIQSEFPVMAFYHFKTNAIKILDAHNVEYDNFARMAKGSSSMMYRMYYRREANKMFQEEVDAASRQQAIFACSERDIRLFDRDVPEVPKFLIPNGVDLDYFETQEEEPEPNRLVFVGMMKYLPNKDGMNFFLDEIFPKIREKVPEVKISIVGGQPGQELLSRRSEHVEVTGFVDDVRPYIRRASVYVVPLRMGGGTRLKILEAMSMKKPLVTTKIGCEGIDLQHMDTAIIADDPSAFADGVVELLQNRTARECMTQKAYELVEQTYSWEKVGEKIGQAYRKIKLEKPEMLSIQDEY